MKRNLIIVLVVILLAIVGFIFFTQKDVVFTKETSLYKAVPVSSPVFVELSSLRDIPSESPVLNHLAGIDDFGWVLEKLAQTNTLSKEVKEIQSQFSKRPLIIALDFIGKNELRPVVISSLRTSEELTGFERLLEMMEGASGLEFTNTKYNGHKVFHVAGSEGRSMHYSVAGGLIVFSPEEILVEKSLRQLNSHNITNINNFNKVNKTVTSQSNVSWYINHNRFPELWANFLNPKTNTRVNEFGETIKRNLRKEVLDLQNYASWSELDMTISDKGIALKGITAADDSLNHFLSVFEGQEAANCQAQRILPKNTSFYIGFTFSDRDLFFKNLENYYVHSDKYYWREEHIKTMEKRFKKGSRTILRNLVKNQVVAAITSVSSDVNQHKTLFIVNNESRSNNREQFETLLKNYAKSKKLEFNTLLTSHVSSAGKTYQIYSFPYPSLPEIWLGKTFRFAKTSFAAFRDDYLIFASTKEGLAKYLNDLDQGATLKNDDRYASFYKLMESKSNIGAFVDVNRIYNLNKSLFNAQFAKGFEKNEEILRKFNGLSWQVLCENNVFINAVNIGLDLKPKEDARAMWEVNVGSQIITTPQLVKNHRDKNANEVIFQDEAGNLQLINAEGKTVWSLPVEGKILGMIHQIDYYRNGRLQYLFNTKDKIYLLDRNGNKVANFPIKLQAPATNGVNVFDYDNNKKYRYFIACENKKVYAYNHEGNIISGWKFGQTAGQVLQPVQFFRVNNKDYIVFSDETKVYVQNRRGETRVDHSLQKAPSSNPVVLNTNGKPKLVFTDKSGNVFYLFFDGTHVQKLKSSLSQNHVFTVADIDGNSVPDFIFIEGKELKVVDENGKKIFTEKFDNNLHPAVHLGANSGKKKQIGVTDSRKNRVYLFDENGKLQQGFPLDGNTAFSIGEMKTGQVNLLVGGEGDVLYNYLLE